MNRSIKLYTLVILSFFPLVTSAQSTTFAGLVAKVVGLVDVITIILTGVAVVVFFAGLVQFIFHAGDKTSVDAGRQKITAGLIGVFVIIAVWGIVKIVGNTFNLIP